jgi:hypothetical protein
LAGHSDETLPVNLTVCSVPKIHFPHLDIKKYLLCFGASALAIQLQTAVTVRWQNDTTLPVIRHTAVSGLKPFVFLNILAKRCVELSMIDQFKILKINLKLLGNKTPTT